MGTVNLKTASGGSVILSPANTAVDVTITVPASTGTVVTADASNNVTVAGKVIAVSYTETVFAITGTTPALTPNNGSIQTWTLSASSTPTAGTWASGQSMTVMIDDGTAYTVTWTSLPVTWVGGSAPTLATTGYNIIELWKVGSVIYGAFVGSA